MKPLKVLVVDDDMDFAESLEEVLVDHGYQVTLAHSGEQDVTLFRNEDFDIAFMDVMLPGKNGVQSFLEIRSIKPNAKVYMMTGYSVEQLLQQAVENGALGVLHKPVAADQVLKAVEHIRPNGIVLVVDDDPDFVEGVQEVIHQAGHKVLVARTGAAAVERAVENDIDVLVLDLSLPILSGLEVYMKLKERGHAPPTIIVTGHAAEEVDAMDTFRSMSVTGCLMKPFEPGKLLKAIDSLLDG